MIKKGSKSITSIIKGNKAIQYIYKGALLVYQAIKNYLVSGAFPLKLEKSVGSDLTNYKIEGNSIQGVNLYNDTLADGYISSSGKDVYSVKNVKNTKVINIPANVTLSFNTTATVGKISFCYYENNIFTRRVETHTNEHKLTTSLQGNENGIRFYITSADDIVSSDVTNVQIVEVPTPETPIEIESVGDKTKNLADVQKGIVYHNNPSAPLYNWVRTETGFKATFLTYYENGAWLRQAFRIGTTKELAGKTVTISFGEFIGASERPILQIFVTDVEGDTAINFDNVSDFRTGYIGSTNSTVKIADNYNDVSSKKLTCTIPEDLENKYVAAAFYLNVSALTNIGDTAEYKNIQVEIGDTVTEYEPYGYKIPVKASGKNFISRIFKSSTKNGITIDVNDDGTVHVYGTATADAIFNPRVYNLQPNTYVLSGCPSGGSNSTYRLLAYFVAPTYNLVEHGNGARYKLLLESDVVIEIKVYSGQTVDLIYKPMLEVGDVGTEYEPYQEPTTTNIYLDEPLRKIGDYIDYIDFANKKVVRNIKEIVFNGSENWVRTGTNISYTGNGEKYRFRLIEYDIAFSTKVITKSNKYLGVTPDDTWFNVQGVSGNSSGTNPWIIIYDENKANVTADEFKAYLKEFYDNGEPVIVDCVLAQPTEETIELPAIPTLKGTTILDSDVTVKPSYVEVEYLGKVR